MKMLTQTDGQRYIGFSLSFCVKDILLGEVKAEEVIYIYSACRPTSATDVEEIIQRYSETYWRQFTKEQISSVLTALEDRIGWSNYQMMRTSMCIATGVWVAVP